MRAHARHTQSLAETVLVWVFTGVVVLGAAAVFVRPPAALVSVSRPAGLQTLELAVRGDGANEVGGVRDRSLSGIPVLCHHYLRGKTTPIGFVRILGALFFNLPLLDDMDTWTQTAASFDAEMAYLKESGYETVDLTDVVAWQRGSASSQRSPW